MAATATASYSICNRVYNISLSNYNISIPANFPQRHSHKPLKLCLKHQQCTFSVLVSFSHVRVVCSPLDGAEVAQEVEPRQEQPEREKEGQELPSDSDEERLYVGNLPFSMTSYELTKLFEEAGSVKSAEIVYDRVTDRSRGFGFVTMASVEDAKKAIRMFDGSQVGGRTAKVNFPEVARGKERLVMGPRARNNNNSNSSGFIDSSYKIYAANLGWRVTSQDLRDAFADLPGVLSAKVVYEKDSRRSRGFGFISFENAEAVEAALQAKNGMNLEGRPLRLNVAVDKIAFQSQPPSAEDTQEDIPSSNELLSSYST